MTKAKSNNVPVTVLSIAFFFLFIILPNWLVRAHPDLLLVRPIFFSGLLFVGGTCMIAGIIVEFRRIISYRDRRGRSLLLMMPIAALLASAMMIRGGGIALDTVRYLTQAEQLRHTTAVIVQRTGPPGRFIFSDRLVLSTGEAITIPYSNLPVTGVAYDFTLLPSEGVALDYRIAEGNLR